VVISKKRLKVSKNQSFLVVLQRILKIIKNPYYYLV